MGGRIREVTVAVDTTGSAGSATGSGVTTERFEGYLLEVELDFDGSAPATTDTTVKVTGATYAALVVTNSSTDAIYAPRRTLVDTAAGAITNSHALLPVNGTITVSVAGCDALTDAVTATLRIQTL